MPEGRSVPVGWAWCGSSIERRRLSRSLRDGPGCKAPVPTFSVGRGCCIPVPEGESPSVGWALDVSVSESRK
eukprot:6516910-Heterocapsa_arctica.AAC.1